jgi:hypothetical protein
MSSNQDGRAENLLFKIRDGQGYFIPEAAAAGEVSGASDD